MTKDNVLIELACYECPEVCGPAMRRPMNQFGIIHLSFVVTDLEAVAAQIERLGG